MGVVEVFVTTGGLTINKVAEFISEEDALEYCEMMNAKYKAEGRHYLAYWRGKNAER